VARIGEKRNAYKVLLGKSDYKRPLGRNSCRSEGNREMDVKEIGVDERAIAKWTLRK
jgi:hypothetical protein